jgi:hypothetical protein
MALDATSFGARIGRFIGRAALPVLLCGVQAEVRAQGARPQARMRTELSISVTVQRPCVARATPIAVVVTDSETSGTAATAFASAMAVFCASGEPTGYAGALESALEHAHVAALGSSRRSAELTVLF